MKARRPRIGVVGAGAWGANVVSACGRLGALAAVCDTDLAALDRARSRFDGVKIFCDYDAMLKHARLDAVAIAVGAPLHAQLAHAAIGAGLDVFVEKPLALSVADAESVVEAARRAGCKVAVGHVLLYHPAVRTMLHLIRQGAVGDVRHVRTRRLSWGRLRSQEDVWWSFAPHDVAVMLEIFGEVPVSVTSASGAYVRPHIADVTYADFAFSTGRTAHVEVAWIDPEKRSGIDVFGSRGVLQFGASGAAASLALIPCGDRLNTRGEPELWREAPQPIAFAEGEPLMLEMEAFCRMVRGGSPVVSDGEEGLAVVRTLAMVHERAGWQRPAGEAVG